MTPADAGEMWKLVSSFLDPPQSFGGADDMDPKTAARLAQVTFVKGDNCVGLAIHGRLQNQFVARIAELRAPAEKCSHRLRQCDQAVYESARFRCTEPRR